VDARLGNMADRIGALIAVTRRVRRGSDSDRIKDEYERTRHSPIPLLQQERKAVPKFQVSRSVTADGKIQLPCEPHDIGTIEFVIAAIRVIEHEQTAAGLEHARRLADVELSQTGEKEIRKRIDCAHEIESLIAK
jgi:hypothetical protein